MALIVTGSACSDNSGSHNLGVGGGLGGGGASSAGGSVANGGTTGSGGAAAGGRLSRNGGTTGLAGQPATGGTSGSGGRIGSGGNSGSGGIAPSGRRVTASGGRPSSGGVTASGGRSGTTDAGAQGGAMATGGATGAGGAGTDGGVINPTACSTGTAQSGDVTVSLSSPQQKITGFGVSSAWAGSYRNASDADYLWSTTKGAGLTLLRIRYGDGLAIAKSAAQNGATVWMTPWGTGTNGGTGGSYTTTQSNPNGCSGSMPVLTNPTGLASALVTWVQNAKTQGVPIYAVSAENEPDSCGINSTTSYSAAQLAAWIDVLGPAMAAIG